MSVIVREGRCTVALPCDHHRVRVTVDGLEAGDLVHRKCATCKQVSTWLVRQPGVCTVPGSFVLDPQEGSE